jgi:hypothetical protein
LKPDLKPDLTRKQARNRAKSLRNALILAPVALFPILLLGALFVFRSTGQKRAVADSAIYLAQSSPQVAAAIGLPIEPGWPVHGSVLESGEGGNAELTIRLRGSRASGTLSERAQRSQRKWQICSLTFALDGGTPLELVDRARTHCEMQSPGGIVR